VIRLDAAAKSDQEREKAEQAWEPKTAPDPDGRGLQSPGPLLVPAAPIHDHPQFRFVVALSKLPSATQLQQLRGLDAGRRARHNACSLIAPNVARHATCQQLAVAVGSRQRLLAFVAA